MFCKLGNHNCHIYQYKVSQITFVLFYLIGETVSQDFLLRFSHLMTFPVPNRHKNRFRMFSIICGLICICVVTPGSEYNMDD
jgi:hypothetical protein